MKKKILLIAVIMAAVFTGCSEKTEDKETNGENNTTETVAVTDLLGREVEVPDDVESVIAFEAEDCGCYAMPTLRIWLSESKKASMKKLWQNAITMFTMIYSKNCLL